MNRDQAKAFYEQADEYCRFIDENVITADTVPSVMKLLMTLYISAINLPETEPETTAPASDTPENVSIRVAEQIPTTYWEIFDPYADDDPVCGDLIDDLSDIAADLRDGMKEYEAGRFGNAIFGWKFGVNNHWGQHIVDALRALHAVRLR